MSKKPSVELKLPILKDMELVATQTAEIVARHMDLSEEKTGEISMALIEACIMHSNILNLKVKFILTF